MKLTLKDKEFLERLKVLWDEGVLRIEFREEGLRRLVLRRNYGTYVDQRFKMTRQGIRWRFERLFNEVYPASYETILWLESSFGTELRPKAMAIAKQRVELNKRAMEELGGTKR
jgi:hypothetical protein